MTVTKDNHRITQLWVADGTGSVIASFWDEIGEMMKPGDIIHLFNGYIFVIADCALCYGLLRRRYVTLHQAMMSLQRAKVGGRVEKVGEFSMAYSEQPHMSRMIWDEDKATSTWVSSPFIINSAALIRCEDLHSRSKLSTKESLLMQTNVQKHL